jgi:hypothetical protein
MKYSLRSLMIVVVVMAGMPGCRQLDIEKELGLKYTPPTVPADLSEHFVPDPESRTSNLLKKGETSLNLKEMYLRAHRYGWDLAIEQWARNKRFEYETKRDWQIDALGLQIDAAWLGYSEAREQIEEKTRQTAEIP